MCYLREVTFGTEFLSWLFFFCFISFKVGCISQYQHLCTDRKFLFFFFSFFAIQQDVASTGTSRDHQQGLWGVG